MKAKLMLHMKHYAVHGPSTWFISSLPPLKWTFIAESSLCWRLKLWAVINEGHGFREASLLISCDTGTRWRPWSAASGKKSSRPRQVRQDFWSAEMLLYVLPPSLLSVLLNCSYYSDRLIPVIWAESSKRGHTFWSPRWNSCHQQR